MFENKLLIIGGKKYLLNLNNVLDKFENNIRINLAVPNGLNGTKISKVYVNGHVYENFLKMELDQLIKRYNEGYEKDKIIKLKKYILNNDVILIKRMIRSNNKINNILLGKFIKYRLDKEPRCGLETIVFNIDKKPVIYGFSINKKNNIHSYFTGKDNEIGHDHDMEHIIIKEMHKKKLIDATLCMLEYSTEAILDCTELKPTNFCLNLLLEKFNTIKIRGDNFDGSLIEKNSCKIESKGDLIVLSK
jgi:hypothetical protein